MVSGALSFSARQLALFLGTLAGFEADQSCDRQRNAAQLSLLDAIHRHRAFYRVSATSMSVKFKSRIRSRGKPLTLIQLVVIAIIGILAASCSVDQEWENPRGESMPAICGS
jgi:hypothetical protein